MSEEKLLNEICERLELPTDRTDLILGEIDAMLKEHDELVQAQFDLDIIRYVVADGDELKTRLKVSEWKKRDTPKSLDDFESDCDGNMSGYCPSCGHEHEGTVGLVSFDFCPWCGQRLKWGDDDVA